MIDPSTLGADAPAAASGVRVVRDVFGRPVGHWSGPVTLRSPGMTGMPLGRFVVDGVTVLASSEADARRIVRTR